MVTIRWLMGIKTEVGQSDTYIHLIPLNSQPFYIILGSVIGVAWQLVLLSNVESDQQSPGYKIK